MRLETSFKTEAKNAEKLNAFIQTDSTLKGKVAVPLVLITLLHKHFHLI